MLPINSLAFHLNAPTGPNNTYLDGTYFGHAAFDQAIAAVPVPAAVWLFGSALAFGFGSPESHGSLSARFLATVRRLNGRRNVFVFYWFH